MRQRGWCTRLVQEAVILRHPVSPPASPMTGSSGVSSTPRLLDFTTDALGYWIARFRGRRRMDRHCERSDAIHSSFAARWIASRSLSSGAHSRDPLARNDAAPIFTYISAIPRRETPEFQLESFAPLEGAALP